MPAPGQSIYAFLLQQGAPPEVISRLMNQIQQTQPGASTFKQPNQPTFMGPSMAAKQPYNLLEPNPLSASPVAPVRNRSW